MKVFHVVSVTFLAGLIVTSATEKAWAHPPEARGVVAAAVQVGNAQEQGPADPVSEADRQVAYFQFESLSWLATRCPSPLQRETIQQALAELQTATQLPQAPSLKTLVAERISLQAKLREQHRVVSLEWSKSGLESAMDVPAIEVARGLSRVVIVEVLNTDSEAANLTLAIGGQNQNAVPWTVLPGKLLWFPLMLTADLPVVKVTVTAETNAGAVTHDFSLPIQIAEPAKLRGRLFDGDLGKVTPGRVWVKGSDHQYRHAGPFAANKSFLEKPVLLSTVPRSYGLPFFYADGTFEIDVPPGPTIVTLERGFEHSLASESIDLAAGETRELTLSSRRFVDMKSQGWISGDTHIHWVTNAWNVDLPLEHLSLVQKAEDLRVVNNLTLLHRTTVDAFVKPSQAPMGPIRNFCSDDYHIEMAEEYRNQNLYGHLCFLNLKWLVLPIGTGPQIAGDDSLDYPINRTASLQVPRERQRRELDALARLNALHREPREDDDRLSARIESFELAYRMQTEAPEAFDLTGETSATGQMYGLDQPTTEVFGRQCLLARRLVERGVRFVQLYHTTGGFQPWDQHSGLKAGHENNALATDQPIAGLLQDLKSRGLLDETLVIWGGEFGRTPTAEGKDGRDHHPFGFSMWLAGGGVRGGMAYGATDEFGWDAIENRVHVHDLHATILHLLGLDHERLNFTHNGRPERLTDPEVTGARVVKEVLA